MAAGCRDATLQYSFGKHFIFIKTHIPFAALKRCSLAAHRRRRRRTVVRPLCSKCTDAKTNKLVHAHTVAYAHDRRPSCALRQYVKQF